MRWVPIIISGVVLMFGINLLLAIRDSKMLDKIEERNTTIEKLFQEVQS
tara:strand:- start:2068 stop:2214 length:147 start_codon:yes stop_codon:yes gene_type:complete